MAVNRELEVVANNLANMSTTAFKAERMMFDEALRKAGASDEISFVVDRASYTDYQTGPLIRTQNQFDIAINGEGWLSVDTPNGVQYTRDGRLVVSPAGELTALDGSPVLGQGGAPIIIPIEEIGNVAIGQDGSITAGEIQIGRIEVFQFENEQNLNRQADGRYTAAQGEARPAERTSILQGAIEGSNVNPIFEVTRLIELSRSYENASRAATDMHDQKKDAINRLGDSRS